MTGDFQNNPAGRGGGDPDRQRLDFLEPLDVHFGRFLERIGGGAAPWLFIAAALVSRSAREGSVCLALGDAAGRLQPGEPGGDALQCPELSTWRRLLLASPVVGKPGEYRPLLLDEKSRLYLYRYWEYEADLARFLMGKNSAGSCLQGRIRREGIDPQRLREGLARLFPRAAGQPGCEGGRRTDWQKIAALAAVVQGLTVITGSPGTGKTATAARVIILLMEMFRGRKFRIALTAPTGKAAARLQEVISRAAQEWCPEEAIRSAMPDRAMTIHRLLGSLPGSPYFRHHRGNPLSLDAVLVDEASMVDLPLLAKLVEALPETARLILLGDRNQLASVEAGAVLSDICGGRPLNAFSREFTGFIRDLTGEDPGTPPPPDHAGGIRDGLIELQTNYRFAENSGINRLSLAVNRGMGREALNILKDEEAKDCRWVPVPSPGGLPRRLKDKFIAYFREYRQLSADHDLQKIFALFGRFRILCALRQGPYGVTEMNLLLERILRETGLIRTSGPWYPGRPVMVTRNDYNLRLFNGDVGLILPDPERRGELSAFFPDVGGQLRRFSPARLPEHETVYALTVHKSQGSEFTEVLLVLPDRDSPVLTRELIYTALTRARRRVEIWGSEEVFIRGVLRHNERSSGLRDALWSAQSGPGAGAFDSP